MYISDSLYAYGLGKAMNKRFIDLMKEKRAPQNNRPASEIANDILARAGVEVISTNGSI